MVLFDIDGTLVDAGGAGRRALSNMFRQVSGVDDAFRNYNFSGKTDRQIIADAWNMHLGRAPSHEEVQQARDGYVALLRAEISVPGYTIKVLPGIRELLDALAKLSVPTGLSTGNIVEGARAKLSGAGLWHYFPFGGFGSDSADRAALTALGAKRGRAHCGFHVPDDRVFVVGDSPLDVDAAHRAGFVSVGVLTGWSSEDEMRTAGPEFLFRDLGDTKKVLEAMGVG